MKKGDKVRFLPSERTRGFCIFHDKYGPKIDHIYEIEYFDDLGNLYFKNNFGPYQKCDVSLVDQRAIAENPLPFPPLRELLKENEIAVPELSVGDDVLYIAAWATPEAALKLGFPIKGRIYRVDKVDNEKLTLKLEGFEMAFSFWHFAKPGLFDQNSAGQP